MPSIIRKGIMDSSIDYQLQSSMLSQNGPSWISGRSKRNIPLPIFQKEPMGRINEFTCKSSLQGSSGSQRLRREMLITKKAEPFLTLPSAYILGSLLFLFTLIFNNNNRIFPNDRNSINVLACELQHDHIPVVD